MEKEEFAKLMAFKNIRGIGNKKAIDLVKDMKNLSSVYNSLIETRLSKDELLKFEKIYDLCIKENVEIISYFDYAYPSKLKKISSPPLVLFAKGNLDLLDKPSIAIVGTRDASKQSIEWTIASSKFLAEKGHVIISGGAKGIDSAAHEGALECSKKTICVLGCGFNQIYPKENIKLIKAITEEGLIISECLPDRRVNRISLLERNRITSGLGDTLLLVATKSNGGAMSQLKVALAQNKRVFCPHPSLGLEPHEGLTEFIIQKKIIPIKRIEELLNFNKRAESQSVLLNIT